MALVLNVSLSSKLPPFPIPKPHLSFPKPQLDSSLFHNTNSATPQGNGINFDHLHLSVTRGSFVALLSASLFFVDPALAFKGGGPYGAEVTRGQDLTGKDFSGKSLIKQDFKTSILRQANFKAANLLGASFFDADLTGADLSDADLRGADFSLANVTKNSGILLQLEGLCYEGNWKRMKASSYDESALEDVEIAQASIQNWLSQLWHR
ncbi:Thylakoid lumenal 15 kDa protein 1, chloroplastic [Vitis vinifera]|uniref:Thylakoid lumenal 15 kDa protein 1, chloroplastic n=1 Tax=Vitis vinifera TaxID=29760 RepID=A0A438JXH2_VITVI|nr:Thylakoid lumenal 15 kDa protein 1, chloroplastic [Vitis vinifera]